MKNVARYPVQNNSAGSIKGSENIYPMFALMVGSGVVRQVFCNEKKFDLISAPKKYFLGL